MLYTGVKVFLVPDHAPFSNIGGRPNIGNLVENCQKMGEESKNLHSHSSFAEDDEYYQVSAVIRAVRVANFAFSKLLSCKKNNAYY